MRLLTAAALMGPVVMWSLGAFATPSITVGACDSTVVGSCPPPNVPITPTTSGVIASGFPSVAFSGVTFEKFDITGSGAAGTTSAGAFFDTQAISVSSTTGGVIDIYFSVNDITRPGSGPVLFTSSFTSNTQQGTSHSVDFSTWYDPANGLFSAADNLAAATINSANPKTEGPFLTVVPSGGLPDIGPTPSVLELYQISLSGCGTTPNTECLANLTVHLTAAPAIPEPASLAVFGTALLGFGAFYRRRFRG